MEKIKHLLSHEYLFETGTRGLTSTDQIFMYLGVLTIAIGVFAFIFKRNKNAITKDLWSRWQGLGFTIGILILIWAGMRYELIRTLSSHFILFVILIIGLIWKLSILKYYFTKYKTAIAEMHKQEEKMKYL